MDLDDSGKVRCDSCGCAFKPEPIALWRGDIEYTFFRCGYCGKAHMIAVTDEGLRQNIAEYVRLAEENKKKRLSETEQLRMQSLKQGNINREIVLRKRHLRENANGKNAD